MKTFKHFNYISLCRKLAIIVLILSFGSLKSQTLTPFGKLQLNIDTNRYVFLSVAPTTNGTNYEFLYKVGSDSMFCTKALFAQDRTTTAIKIEKKFKSFLEKEIVEGFNKVKIDLSHTLIEQSFVVSCVIFSGPLERWVSILDEYYLAQVYPLLVTFNGFLPPKEKFNLEFNKTVRDRLVMGQLIEIATGYSQENNQLNNKRITMDFEKNIYRINYYDTIEKKTNYKPLNLKTNTLTFLKSKTLKCVNSFCADTISLKITGSSSKTTLVRYQFPGIYIETRVKSLNKRTRNAYHDEFFNLLNSKLSKNDKLNY